MIVVGRRGLAVISLVIIVVCVIVMLNFTASNPTGRRYSSEPVTTVDTGASSASDVTAQQEVLTILATDLDTAANEGSDEVACGCHTTFAEAPPETCGTCAYVDETISGFVVPDVITGSYIAEARNVSRLTNENEIRSFAVLAQGLDVPLWIFVRRDTQVAQEYIDIVDVTGGGIVDYFVEDGFTDPVRQSLTAAIALAGVVLVLMVGWEFASRNQSEDTAEA